MTRISVEQFKQRVKPAGRSKLDPFRDDLLALYSDGYSLDQLLEFLALNEIQVAKSTLHGYLKRRAGVVAAPVQKKVNSAPITKAQGGFKHFTPPAWADPKTSVDDLI